MVISALLHGVIRVVDIKPFTDPCVYSEEFDQYLVAFHAVELIEVYVLRDERRQSELYVIAQRMQFLYRSNAF